MEGTPPIGKTRAWIQVSPAGLSQWRCNGLQTICRAQAILWSQDGVGVGLSQPEGGQNFWQMPCIWGPTVPSPEASDRQTDRPGRHLLLLPLG